MAISLPSKRLSEIIRNIMAIRRGKIAKSAKATSSTVQNHFVDRIDKKLNNANIEFRVNY